MVHTVALSARGLRGRWLDARLGQGRRRARLPFAQLGTDVGVVFPEDLEKQWLARVADQNTDSEVPKMLLINLDYR